MAKVIVTTRPRDTQRSLKPTPNVGFKAAELNKTTISFSNIKSKLLNLEGVLLKKINTQHITRALTFLQHLHNQHELGNLGGRQ